MSDDRTITTRLVFEPDNQSQRAAQSAYDQIQSNLDELVKLQAQLDKEIAEGSAADTKAQRERAKAVREAIKNQEALRKSAVSAAQDELRLQSALRKEREGAAKEAERAAKEARREQERFNDALRDTEDALGDVGRQQRRNQGGGGGLLAAAERGRGEATRRGVGALGDVDTALSTFASATGQASVTIAADLFAVAEQFELLRGAAGGVVGNLKQAIGPLGIAGFGAAAAVTAVGIAAVGVALNDLFTDLQQQTRELEGAIDGAAEAERFLANATTEETQNRIEELRRQVEVEQSILAEREEAYQSFEQQAGAGLGTIAKIFSDSEQALADSIQESEQSVAGLESQLSRLEEGLENGATAANDAAEAERLLAEERQRAAVAAVDAQIAAQQAEIAARSQNAEQIQEQINSIAQQGALLQEQIRQYEALGQDTTALNDQLLQLQLTSARLTQNALPLAQARDRENEAVERSQERLEELEEARFAESQAALERADGVVKAEQDLAARQVEIAEQARDKVADALADTNEQLADLQRDLQGDLRDLADEAREAQSERQLELQRDLLSIERDTAQQIVQIRRDAQEEELDLIAARDFRGLRSLRERTEKEVEEARRSEQEQRRETEREFNQANADAARQFERERADRLQAFNQANADAIANYQKQVADARTFYDEQQRLAIEGFNNIISGLTEAFQQAQRDIQFGLNPEDVQREIINQRASRLPSALPTATIADIPTFSPQPFPGGGAFGGNNTAINNSRTGNITNNFTMNDSMAAVEALVSRVVTNNLREVLGT